MDIMLLDEKTVILSFKKWLLSALFLPYDIDRNIKVNIRLHVLPLGDILLDFENRWQGEIGVLQQEHYEKECDIIKEFNRNNSEQKKLPSRKDYITWSYGQGSYRDKYILSNQLLSSFEDIPDTKTVMLQFIKIYSSSFFDNFNTESLRDKITDKEISSDQLKKRYSKRCRNYAIISTKYPGEDQRNIDNEVHILDFSIKKKYLPLYILDICHKKKKFSYCCDAVTALYFTGTRPQANYLRVRIISIIGLLTFSIYFMSSVLPIEEWANKMSIQQNTIEITLLVIGILSISYVVLSVLYETSKASIRKDEIEYYGDD